MSLSATSSARQVTPAAPPDGFLSPSFSLGGSRHADPGGRAAPPRPLRLRLAAHLPSDAKIAALLAGVGLDFPASPRFAAPFWSRTHVRGGWMVSTGSAYSASFATQRDDPVAHVIWGSFATNRCRLFMWLACKNRFYTNERRFRRGLSDSDKYPFCNQSGTTAHMLLHCRSLRPIWSALQSIHPDATTSLDLVALATDRQPPDKFHSTVLLIVLWNIWKRMNAMVFNATLEDPNIVIHRCSADAGLWAHRCSSPTAKCLMKDWAIMLSHLARCL